MAHFLVGHVAFDFKLSGSIPAIFFEKQLLGSTPTLLTVLCGLAWCAVCRRPRWSEFPLMLRLSQSPFAKDGWGLTNNNKTG